jgi:hypothetical protein
LSSPGPSLSLCGAPMLLTGLGDDEISFIMKYLSIRHLVQARQVCKRFTWSVLLGCYGNSTGITFIENLLHFFIADREQVAATSYSAAEAIACSGGPHHSALTGAQGLKERVAAAQRLLPVLFALPRGVQVLLCLLCSACSPRLLSSACFSPPPTFLLSSACSPPPALLRLLSFRLLSSACSPALLRLLSSDDSGISQTAYPGCVHSARQRGELFLRPVVRFVRAGLSAAAYPPYPPGEERSHFAQVRYSNSMRWYILPPIGKGRGRSGVPTYCEADAFMGASRGSFATFIAVVHLHYEHGPLWST